MSWNDISALVQIQQRDETSATLHSVRMAAGCGLQCLSQGTPAEEAWEWQIPLSSCSSVAVMSNGSSACGRHAQKDTWPPRAFCRQNRHASDWGSCSLIWQILLKDILMGRASSAQNLIHWVLQIIKITSNYLRFYIMCMSGFSVHACGVCVCVYLSVCRLSVCLSV